jgi:hemerythrin-like domain-containing protein
MTPIEARGAAAMQATEILSQEHRVIEQVLNCLEKFVDRAEAGGSCDWWDAGQMYAFFRDFADRCHHAKEEDCLFPKLEARGFNPEAGPTGVMRSEHAQGRRFLSMMKKGIEAGARGDRHALNVFARNARGYLELLRAHIHKEDHCLFPMADQTLGVRDQDEMLREFANVEHKPGFEEAHEKYLVLADSLAEKYGVERIGPTCSVCCGHH